MRAVFTTEVLFRALVDNDFTVARFDENAGEAAELCGDQCRSIDFQPLPIIPIRCQNLRLLCRVVVLVARVNFQFADIARPSGAFNSMPSNRDFNHAQDGGQSSLQGRLFDTADVARCGDSTLCPVRLLPVTTTLSAFIRTTDVITDPSLRAGVFALVYRAGDEAILVARRPRVFAGRVNNIPVAFYGFWFSCKVFIQNTQIRRYVGERETFLSS